MRQRLGIAVVALVAIVALLAGLTPAEARRARKYSVIPSAVGIGSSVFGGIMPTSSKVHKRCFRNRTVVVYDDASKIVRKGATDVFGGFMISDPSIDFFTKSYVLVVPKIRFGPPNRRKVCRPASVAVFEI
jgi:hypothetical protein